jgi:hypothetical protein
MEATGSEIGRRWAGARRLTTGSATLLVGLALSGCGGSDREDSSRASVPDEYGHVHGLGVNPADGSLYIAAHSGLFRAANDDSTVQRVGDSRQDTMGFTVVSRNTFLGSGHPDARENKPSHLGLILSEDAGRTWRELALGGQVDLHIIRVGERLTYGFDALSGKLLVSDDAASSWSVAQPPAPLIDFVLDPDDERHLIAATADRLYRSPDRGADWRAIPRSRPGHLAWSRESAVLLAAAPDGTVRRSADGGRSWRKIGTIGGEPTAMTTHGGAFYVATADGTIKVSEDRGRSWSVRAEPPA